MKDIKNFDYLFKILQERIRNSSKNSYVATLVKGGKDKILQKIGEESIELAIEAAKDKENKKFLIHETTDLFFHLWILMAYLNISPQDILNELNIRHKSKSK